MRYFAMLCGFVRPLTFFASNGLIVGSWATMIPHIGHHADLDEAAISVVLLAFALGGIGAMLITPKAIDRWGCDRVSLIGGLGFAAMFAAVSAITSWGGLVAAAFVFGGFHGSMDVAINAGAIQAEKKNDRRFMSKLHGCFSLGAAVGAAGFGWLYSLVPVYSPLIAAVVVCSWMVLTFLMADSTEVETDEQQQPIGDILEPQSSEDSATKSNSIPKSGRSLVASSWSSWSVVFSMGAIAFCCLVAEGAMVDWLVKLFQVNEQSTASAGLVYASFAIGMSVCRFTGDLISHAFGDRKTIIYGCLLSSAALAAVLLIENPLLACLPAMLSGAGLANVIPSAFRSCGGSGKQVGDTLAKVTTIGYAGFLFGPPIIGVLAEATTLRIALAVPALTLLMASLIAATSSRLKSSSAGDFQEQAVKEPMLLEQPCES